MKYVYILHDNIIYITLHKKNKQAKFSIQLVFDRAACRLDQSNGPLKTVKPEEQTDNMSIKWKVTYPVAFVTTPQLEVRAINLKNGFLGIWGETKSRINPLKTNMDPTNGILKNLKMIFFNRNLQLHWGFLHFQVPY